MQDGVVENFTAAMLEPYLDARRQADRQPRDRFVDPEALQGYVTRLDAEGFQVHFHAIGDRAVREALDAFEAARRRTARTTTATTSPTSKWYTRTTCRGSAQLGVVANGQPLWAAYEPQMDELTIPFLGPERAGWQYPFGSLLRAARRSRSGAIGRCRAPTRSRGSTSPSTACAPSTYPYGRRDTRRPVPARRADRARRGAPGFTLGSAYVNHLDAETGTIEVGKLADLVVLDRNLFAHPAGEVRRQGGADGDRGASAVCGRGDSRRDRL